VYKALDIRREFYNNDDWEPPLLNSPTTSASPSPSQSPSQSPTPTSSQDPFNNDSQQPEQASTTRAASPKNKASKTLNQYVALKRIYHTSSPRRIANEILILKKLKGSPCVSPLITAFRQQDQVFVVMPYIQHDDFKATFYHFGMSDIKHYLKSLFTALHHLHKHNILHRDVKPNNFLYSIRKKTGYLIDFGLAEHEKEGLILEAYAAKLEAKTRENIFVKSSKEAAIARSSSSSSSTTSVLVSLTTNKENRSTSSQQQATEEGGSSQQLQQENGSQQGGDQQQQQHQRRIVGQVKNDARHQVRANRAGTRGFRAPEILMRVTRQTCGKVILLSFLLPIWTLISFCFFYSN
jgi:cell division control protein 7